MSSKLIAALNGKNQGRPPVWFMRQAGRYMQEYRALREKQPFMALCHEPDLITQVTLLPIKKFSFDAAIVFSDILMVPEAMGFKVRFDEGTGPIIDNPLTTEAHAAKYDPLKQSYLPKAIAQLKRELGQTPLIGFAGAPFTLACYLIEGKTSRDFRKVKSWIYSHPETFKKWIDLLTDAVIQALKLQKECDALQLFDSWAEILPLHHFEAFCLSPLKKIKQALQEIDKPLIYFCRGSSYLASDIASTAVNAISLDSRFPIAQVRQELPTITLQGNLEPEALFAPLDKVKSMTRDMLTSMKNDPAFIFNLGHGILPQTPENSVQTILETTHSFIYS